MCLLPLQLLADGFNYPTHAPTHAAPHAAPHAPTHAATAEQVSSCPLPVVDDDANMAATSIDLSALTSPATHDVHHAASAMHSPAYLAVIPYALFFPVPKPPPRHERLRFDL